MNHYQCLGVPADSSAEEIKSAYRKLAMKWHPDRHTTLSDKDTAGEKFKAINEAYSALSDPFKRDEYDRSYGFARSTHTNGPGHDPFGFGFSSGFTHSKASQTNSSSSAGDRDPFGFGSGFREDRDFKHSLPKGANVQWKTSISIDMALNGGEVRYSRKEMMQCDNCGGRGSIPYECPNCDGEGFRYNRGRAITCSKCSGHGSFLYQCETCKGKCKVKGILAKRLRIPAGVSSGAEIVAKNLGKGSTSGGLAGDLYITITIKPEGGFKFSGHDILGDIKLSFTTALLGGPVEITLPTRRTLTVRIPARTNSGKKIRLSGVGLPNRNGGAGDLILTTSIVLPKSKRKLTPAEEAFVRSLDF